jgi:polysaccharide biosynthesis/export protein
VSTNYSIKLLVIVLCFQMFSAISYAVEVSDQVLQELITRPGTNIEQNQGNEMNASLNVDNGVDSALYFIGTGDIFQASLIESPSVAYRAEINQNCDVFIPNLGVLTLGKVPLYKAKKAISDFIHSKIKTKSDVYISFIKGKKATISITGAITNQGTFTLPGTNRISDAIKIANNNILPSLNECNYREIALTHGDSITLFDLFQFFFKNDLAQNPYIYPGDIITIRRSSRAIYIFGAIRDISGQIPIKRNESLRDFLSLFTLDASIDSSNIIIQRGATEESRSNTIYRFDDPNNIFLCDKDFIFIPSKRNYPALHSIAVSGSVKSPGQYPIIPATTTVEEIIDMAGGVTQNANNHLTVIIRQSKSAAAKLKQNAQASGIQIGTIPDISLTRPEISSAINKLSTINDYTVISINNNQGPIKLEDGDVVIVPRKDPFVYLSGNVYKPGAIPYTEGQKANYYIKKAGGYTSLADKGNVFVIAQHGIAIQFKDRNTIDEGDIIVIPDSQENKTMRNLFIPIVQALATTVMAIVAVITVLPLK